MGYQLGIDLGTTYTAAAVHRDGRVEVVTLGNRAPSVPSTIFLKEDESILTGDAAARRAVTEPDRVAREFKRRVGDPTPLLLGATPYSAEALMAKLLRWTVDAVSEREGSPPDHVALSHPANWGPYKTDLLGQAVRLADLSDVTTITEPEAAAIFYASNERVEPGSVVAVYDLGGGTFDSAVLRKTDDGWEILGAPEGIERLGGIDFDEAVFAHVRQALGGRLDELDPNDAAAMAAVARLRQEVVEAKEALSGDTDVSIPVLLPNLQTEVRLTRSEFEGMIRPTLQETIGALRRALESARVQPEDVSAVLLVGGSSRIPLVAQLVGAEFGRPVAVDAHPKHAIALGAAIAASRAAAAVGESDVEVEAGEDVNEPASVAADLDTGVAPAAAAATGATGEAGSPPPPDETTSGEPPTPAGGPDGSETAAAEPPSPTEEQTAPAAAAAFGGGPVEPPAATGRGDEPPRPAPSQRSGQRGFPVGIVAAVAAAIAVVVVGLLVVSGGGGDDDTASGDDPAAASDTQADGTEDTEATEDTGTDDTTADTAAEQPTGPAAVIDTISVENDRYVVQYDAVGFTPLINDAGAYHVHFFWDTLPAINAGVNGPDPGSWLIWDTPFTVTDAFFDVSARPEGARGICVIVADNSHGVADVDGDGEVDTGAGECEELPPA